MFEFLILEGAQAGLSWITILRRREQYRAAFAGFDVLRVSRFTDRDIERLMGDSGIIRHRAKICTAIDNARFFCAFKRSLAVLVTTFGALSAVSRSLIAGRMPRRYPQKQCCQSALVMICVAADLDFLGRQSAMHTCSQRVWTTITSRAVLGARGAWRLCRPIELSRRALAGVFGEQFFPDSHRLWGDFDQFIVFNKL